MIRDLLWACPLCSTIDALVHAGRGAERCRTCHAIFRRGTGANIEATLPDGEHRIRPAAEWAALLPDPETILRWDSGVREGPLPVREAEVVARIASGSQAIHRGREYLGRIERLGPRLPGRVRLHPHGLELVLDNGEAQVWPLDRITAVQPSSSTLQIKVRGEPVVSLKFLRSSPRLWEALLCAALRTLYRERGLGEIVEFQPRIEVR